MKAKLVTRYHKILKEKFHLNDHLPSVVFSRGNARCTYDFFSPSANTYFKFIENFDLRKLDKYYLAKGVANVQFIIDADTLPKRIFMKQLDIVLFATNAKMYCNGRLFPDEIEESKAALEKQGYTFN